MRRHDLKFVKEANRRLDPAMKGGEDEAAAQVRGPQLPFPAPSLACESHGVWLTIEGAPR
jgi:hypothetical protein